MSVRSAIGILAWQGRRLVGPAGVPLDHGVADGAQVLDRRLERDRALGPDHLDARLEQPDHLGPNGVGTLGVERLGVVDVADEADPAVDRRHRLGRGVLRVEVERGHPGLGDVAHPVDRLAADVEDDRARDPLGELDVQVPQVAVVVLAGDEVAGRVVGQRDGVGAGLELGDAEGDRRSP